MRVTLGPKAKRVLIEKKWGAPLVCDDGVIIAKELELKDPVENIEVRALRQAAECTGEAVGDGTTTSTLLAHAIDSDVDLLEVGIVDATQVVRTALENAVSVAGILLLTEATLTEVPEPAKPVGAGREPAFAGDEM